jgi:hypothetical protein
MHITIFRIQDERFLWADLHTLFTETILLGQIPYMFVTSVVWCHGEEEL